MCETVSEGVKFVEQGHIRSHYGSGISCSQVTSSTVYL